jgi:hypothetical protein
MKMEYFINGVIYKGKWKKYIGNIKLENKHGKDIL